MRKHNQFIAENPAVEEWLRNRPESTKRNFAVYLKRFCETMEIKPEEWRGLDRFEARDLAWKFVKPYIAESPGTARNMLTALKSWYRNKDGEQLPFDSSKGGKHYFRVRHPKWALEHIPSKREMYQIVDMASSLRDKAILLFLFQSGVRVNVLEHIKYGQVKDHLDKDIIILKITGDLDHKLRSRDIPFYYTFLNGEGSETLKRYCEVTHKNSGEDTPLFPTKGDKAISQRYIWQIVRMCVKRAGFNPKTMWTHTIRKAFRKQVAQTENVDFEFKEMVMGHAIGGSRESYFDRHNLNWFVKEYRKFNFGREAVGSEARRLRVEMDERLQEKDAEIAELKQRLNGFTLTGDQVQELLSRIEKLEKQAKQN